MAWRIVRKISVCAIALVAIFGILDNFALFVFDAYATTSDLDASATIGASATIALNTNNVAFSILPSSEGTFGKSNALVVSTYTNNDYNCDVTMIADSANLTNGSYTIPSLEAGSTYTESTFTNNSWGYQIESGNYKPVITTEAANPIKTITTMTGSAPDTTNIYFAAKFTTAVKAGDYTNTITFASTCTPPSRTYMQNVNEATLATLMPNVGDTTTLYDARDEKDYAITKLADGYYWMTQNLRLGKGNGEIIVLDSTNSDLPSGATFNLKASGMGSNQPDATGDCNVGNWYPGDDNETETNTSHLCINTSDTETYGVYYNWYTATAGTGTYSVTLGEAAGSICPKGWILPPNSGERSYYNLLFTKGGLSDKAGSATAMQTAPYNFPLSGGSYGEGIDNVGSYGGFWSSTASNDYRAYYLDFDSSLVYPQNYDDKGYGYSVRCVFGPSTPTFAVTASMDSGVSSVTFTGDNTTQTATSASPTVSLKQGVSYTITANLASGYDFSGWSTTSGITVSSTTTNPTTITATGTGTLSVSSVLDCAVTTFSGYMQDMTTTTVTNACVGTSGTLTDRRDSKTYTVKKLADGKLWMTENLAIDLTATSYNDLYGTGTNAGKMTNATSEALGYLKGTTTGTTSDQWAMAAVKKTWTSSYSNSEPWIAVDSSTSGVCNNAYCVNSDKSWSSTSVTSQTINDVTSVAQGKIGVYYNYCAASAGSYCWGGSGTSSSGSPSSDPNPSSLRDITSDICPYGWHLPTSSSSGESQALYTAYSSSYTDFQTALSTPLSGHFLSGKANNQGLSGGFWSSTWNDSTRMYLMGIHPTSVNPSSNTSRPYGFPVRCMFGS